MRQFLCSVMLASVMACGQEAGHGSAPPAGEAHGEAAKEQAHEPANPNEIWWKWANFAILAGGIGWLASKHGGPYFQARAEAIRAGLREAVLVREDAERRSEEIEGKVANLTADLEQLRAQSRDEMRRESERVQGETEVLMRKVQAQAEAEIASAAKHATQELKAYAAGLALELAERQIRDRLTPETQNRLADSFVGELRQKASVN